MVCTAHRGKTTALETPLAGADLDPLPLTGIDAVLKSVHGRRPARRPMLVPEA